MIVIQAVNIHQGGGAVLLNDIVLYLDEHNISARLYVDIRYPFIKSQYVEVIQTKTSILERFKVEIFLSIFAKKNKSIPILFFGNLPPLFSSNKLSFLFFQNTILLHKNSKFLFNIKIRLKHLIEKIWLRIGINRINTVYVQSESVKRLFTEEFPGVRVKTLAFSNLSKTENKAEKKEDFIYIASAEPHKNHINLIRAWIYLFENGVKLKLTLTVSKFSKIEQSVLDSALEKGVRIEFRPNLSHDEVLKLYTTSKALIYPSLTESFGLPLIEAKQAGLPIIASELDFVRDLVEPVQTFDPHSELSIARAVQRFLGLTESCKTEVKTAADFINEILSG